MGVREYHPCTLLPFLLAQHPLHLSDWRLFDAQHDVHILAQSRHDCRPGLMLAQRREQREQYTCVYSASEKHLLLQLSTSTATSCPPLISPSTASGVSGTLLSHILLGSSLRMPSVVRFLLFRLAGARRSVSRKSVMVAVQSSEQTGAQGSSTRDMRIERRLIVVSDGDV